MDDSIKETVREKYAGLARAARAGGEGSCCCSCPPSGCGCGGDYTPEEVAGLPPELLNASLGCGNPTALAGLQPGQVVLDLGSGAGLDVFLAARRVGPEGKVYGMDMTDEMLTLAEENRRRAGVENVVFIKGDMENIPLPDDHVDVIISNCVVNLSADKARVFKEAFRVLKPGGRLAISDLLWQKEVPSWVRQDVELWTGCVAGALTVGECRRLLEEAGFEETGLEVTRVYG
ncbi:MAG: arsenite methyltransferase, partial [Peptococcaceae bacterium]|nr:arsenite methyltransferase [Peptococcaceae bacterium]